MKKVILYIFLLTASVTTWAQTATVKGTFNKLLPNGVNVDRVFIFKSEKGELTPLSLAFKARHDQTFSSQLTAGDLNAIRYVGLPDEQYPVYLRAGETLNMEAGDGGVVYSGNVNAENKVFADWYKLILPIRKFGYKKNGYRLSPAQYVAALDSLAVPVETFIKNINTGNEAFDRYVKHMLPYSFKLDLLIPFTMGFAFGSKGQYPAHLVNLLEGEKFTDRDIWTLPFGYSYIQFLGFTKHIIYNSEMGTTSDLIIPEISNQELKAEFILADMAKGTTPDLVKFIDDNKKFMLTDVQKRLMQSFEQRIKVKVPGNSWIDFSYPDIKGKTHKLSDYIGKVILIDVWATWCAPCLAEQPALEELEKFFKGKDVTFISLSIDTDKEKWKQMVTQKKFSGLHLFSNNEGVIVKEYGVNEIPRFIVFDKNGKTVDINAPRPSDPKLKALIQSKL